jgi:3-isopropylmalate/(R)-2-methylmalate dehydratase small subunit
VLPAFATEVRPGDVLVAGRNMGAGSSREQAPAALKHLGVAALIAESFAGLFYRNALNLGLPALVCAQAKRIRDGDELKIDYAKSEVVTPHEIFPFEPIPAHLLEMVRDGGLLPHLEKRLKCRTTS